MALIPGISIGSILFYGIYESQRNELEASALQTARALLQAIDSELNKTQAIAFALAKSEYLVDKDFAAFHQRAQEVLRASGAGNNCVLSDITGQQILNTARPYPETLPRHGNIDQMNRVLQSGRPAISDIYIGAVLQRPLFSIDLPVSINGKITYVLSIGLLPEHFNRLLQLQKLPTGWLATLLDSGGTVAARSQNPEQTIGKKATPDLLAKIRLQTEGTMASHTLEGRPAFVAFSRSDTSRWTVAVAMEREVLYGSLYRPMALVGLNFLVLLFGGGQSWPGYSAVMCVMDCRLWAPQRKPSYTATGMPKPQPPGFRKSPIWPISSTACRRHGNRRSRRWPRAKDVSACSWIRCPRQLSLRMRKAPRSMPTAIWKRRSVRRHGAEKALVSCFRPSRPKK